MVEAVGFSIFFCYRYGFLSLTSINSFFLDSSAYIFTSKEVSETLGRIFADLTLTLYALQPLFAKSSLGINISAFTDFPRYLNYITAILGNNLTHVHPSINFKSFTSLLGLL